ncbi:MAG: ribbon-helix-helix protein, CopG family [Candidatus Riflebacteria bacterium]|nr:ribbon-helix-helix protein, CopG family [Candidatus Riflebacteria bacterium]
MKRVTLTLPADLLGAVDGLSRSQGTSRSRLFQQVVAGFLEERRKRKLVEDLAEGYRAMASESVKLSEQFARLENEALLAQTGAADDDVEW